MSKLHLVCAITLASSLVGCGNGGSSPVTGDAAAGSGGAGQPSGTGGTPGTGGRAETGGAPATGGPGGKGAAGGTPATGGQAAPGGGASGKGGRGATGGTVSSGGASASGGAQAGGGRGGSAGRGGFSGSAGSAGGAALGGGPGSGGAVGGTTGKLIRNDLFWKDTAGTPLYSQGGGVLLVGDTYYWYGVKYNGAVSYAAKPTSSNSDTSFAGVTIYSSKDLATWKLENTVTFSNAGDWFGRMGVVYNAKTKKYVMVAQGAGGVFFATSDTPAGAYVFDNVATNLSGIANGATGDQTVFQDDDGKAYVICSSAMGRGNLYVVPLRDADFLALGTPTRIFGGVGREGNALFKYAAHYYFCSSDLHGWNASHTYCVSATNILGPYGSEFVMDNTDADFSHVTQTGFFITVKGATQSFVIFAGDRWSDFAGNGLGYNQWMPLTFAGTTPSMASLSEWSIDAAAGTWSVGPGNNYALNPSFEADRVAMTTPAGWTSTGGANVTGGHTGRWAWQLSGAGTLDQQIASLPNGSYTLSAWIKGSGATGAKLFAKDFGGADASTSLAAANGTWANVSLSGIAVSNGACHVGASTTAGTLTIDDIVLLKN